MTSLAPIAAQLDALCKQGRFETASDMLHHSAKSGDIDALFTLALWRIGGSIIQRDLSLARKSLRDAANAGHPEASPLYAYFLAAGVGGSCEWQAALEQLRYLTATHPAVAEQMVLLDQMKLRADGSPADEMRAGVLSIAPRVSYLSGFLSAAEAAYVRKVSAERLQPSMVVDPATGAMMRNPIRRSDDAMFGVFHEDLVISAINKRIAVLSDTLPEQGEPLIVLKYEQGGEYRAHGDALADTDNQRIATVILYLNSDYKGGETRFVETGLTVRGQVGDALLFRNVTSDGRSDALSRHAGLPVVEGVKWIATRWIREHKYSYPAPRPALA